MGDKPILFSSQMVRALNEGMKTQTRRIIKPQPHGMGSCRPTQREKEECQLHYERIYGERDCPYGEKGDYLWVRETFQVDHYLYPIRIYPNDAEKAEFLKAAIYKADNERPYVDQEFTWRPSIFMKRFLSRTTLEITDIRTQRLHEIDETDAIAEGFTGDMDKQFPTDWYKHLWIEINGDKSWDANPWVWAITFKVHPFNIDKLIKRRAA